MKKTLFIITVIGSIMFYSCSSDDPKSEDPIDPIVKDSTANPLTSEQNKQLLQSIAIDFVSEMSSMEQTNTSQALISFGLLIDQSEPETGRAAKNMNSLNKPILSFIQQRISSVEFAKSGYRVSTHDPETIQELFDEYKGTFAWNSSSSLWEYTAGGSVVAFTFPGTDGGTSNNATLTLRNYEGTIISNPIEDDYTGDLPVSLEVDLFVDNIKELAYSFHIDYSSQGEPENVTTSLFINPFELSVELINTESKVGTSVLFTNDAKVLIDIDTEINGNFDADVIKTVDDNDDNIVNVIFNGSVSVTLMNFNMSANVNFKDFYNQIKDMDTYHDKYYDGEPTQNFTTNAQLLEDALNDYLILTTKYVSTNRKAADAEWYTTLYEDEYEIRIDLGARMVFEDESKVDIEDYFSAGFGELETEINKLISQFGNDIGEDLDPIEFN